MSSRIPQQLQCIKLAQAIVRICEIALGLALMNLAAVSLAATEEEAFAHYQASVDSIIQSKCIVCHVSGGSYGGVSLVYVRGSSLSQQEANFGKLKAYIERGRGSELLSRPKGNGHSNQNLSSDQTFALERLVTLVEEIEEATNDDPDEDGVANTDDNCPDLSNASQSDLDNDGAGDACDEDRDGDSVANDFDDFPDDAEETKDSDGDGVGDNADAFDLDSSEISDFDLDGTGDNADLDDDDDGYSDILEIELGTDPQNAYLCPDDCLRFDFDHDGSTAALTDGLVAIRYLFGFTGESLVSGASTDSARLAAAGIEQFLDAAKSRLDIDGDGESQALTDGLLLIRYLFGFRGESLFQGATSIEATRSELEIEAYLAERTQMQ